MRRPAEKSVEPKPQIAAPAGISLGPEVCSSLSAAEQREWLVTNGLGGFASGTVAGSATRRYHGLLFAALHPPASRTQLVGSVDEIARLGEQTFELATHRWLSGAVSPEGYKLIHSFHLEGTIPAWTYQLGSARLEKRIWMRYGEATTFVRYTRSDATPSSTEAPTTPLALELKALVNYRGFHSTTYAGHSPNEWRMSIDRVENGVRVTAFSGATPFLLKCLSASCEPQHVWYRDFFFSLERDRGLDDHEDQLFAALFRAELLPGQSLTLVFSTNPAATLDGDAALSEEQQRQSRTLSLGVPISQLASPSSLPNSAPSASNFAPDWLPQLLLAADQFLVSRPLPDQPRSKSVIAGYHWFGDWGRDTMVALPGLALATGRPEVARQILLAFARYVNRGMLPNNFPDLGGGAPGYNTIDATLWYFEAIRKYHAAVNDTATLAQLFPVLEQILEAHLSGTRYNIHVDPDDGLLYGGGPGVQLTWMDAKIGDWCVTPRTGKPVEVNALWLNALDAISVFAEALGSTQNSASYADHAARARASFAKFWNPARNCCYDVIDCPGAGPNRQNGSDAAIRPNQIFAVSLGTSPLSLEQQKSVVDCCVRHLLTPYGLRTLAPGETGYSPRYIGGPAQRDAAYHQGTVWPWLLGPFAEAHLRVYRDRSAALAFFEPLARSLTAGGFLSSGDGSLGLASYGLGTVPELFDADPPHLPGGAISQAWSLSELLRLYRLLSA